METLVLKKSEFMEMKQSLNILQYELSTLRNTLMQYVSTDNIDLRMVLKQFLSKTDEVIMQPTENKYIPEITEGDKNISPTLLFGKWSKLTIDAKKLRQESWREY